MDPRFDETQQELRLELREYFARILPPGSRSTGHGERSTAADRAVMRRMGEDGWLGLGYPPEYGGRAGTLVDTFIFFDEALRAGAPVSHVTLMTVGPALLRWGSERQKEELIPRILAGEVVFTIGYSEPEAGTDLGNLATRARREGSGFVVDGQKTYSSGADHADYIWLAARTEPGSVGHRGISILIVPTAGEGFSFTPIPTLSTHVTTATFYDGVRVPAEALVGRENEGWSVIADQLALERLTMVMPGPLEQLYLDVRAWAAAESDASGASLIARPWVQFDLARVRLKLEGLRLFTWRTVWAAANDALDDADPAACKVMGSEVFIECARLLLGVIGEAGAVRRGSVGAVLQGRAEEAYRAAAIKSFGGGVNEVLRHGIVRSALAMPPVPHRVPTR